MSGLYIEISRDAWTNGVQISVNDNDGGYRLSGPKFNGSQSIIAKAVLGKYERAELRKYLDRADAAEAGTSGAVHSVNDIGQSLQAMDGSIANRLREIAVWMVRDMTPGWQGHGETAHEAAALLEACEPYLKPGETPVQRIQRDVADNEGLCLLLAKERSK